ncbi:DUF3168 domain-containing protein [Burkholderia anthina]|uniref:DUF3168 domain-containing protein n=1 Tax=Burkholderia anthina TaxID=179879 RepID=UPI001AA05E27|nr:DUF3168 domain-containing protein [Burkholderia anthina]QTD91761.1 DUF3168 domain-containing protein [Burkholderia anthina]
MVTAESVTFGAIGALADGRVYPDEAPAGVVRPYIVYQAVGGEDEATFDGAADTRNCRMQIAVWASSRSEASEIGAQVRDLMTAPPVLAAPIGAPVSVYETDTKLRGSRQDFSIWYR